MPSTRFINCLKRFLMLNQKKKKSLLKVSKVFKDGGRGKKSIFRGGSEEKANNLGT